MVICPAWLRSSLERAQRQYLIAEAIADTADLSGAAHATYFCLQTKSHAHWEQSDHLQTAMTRMGCEIIDYRQWHPNDHFGLALRATRWPRVGHAVERALRRRTTSSTASCTTTPTTLRAPDDDDHEKEDDLLFGSGTARTTGPARTRRPSFQRRPSYGEKPKKSSLPTLNDDRHEQEDWHQHDVEVAGDLGYVQTLVEVDPAAQRARPSLRGAGPPRPSRRRRGDAGFVAPRARAAPGRPPTAALRRRGAAASSFSRKNSWPPAERSRSNSVEPAQDERETRREAGSPSAARASTTSPPPPSPRATAQAFDAPPEVASSQRHQYGRSSRLSREFHTVALDLAGHGDYAFLEEFELKRSVDRCVGHLRTLGVAECLVVATSLGGNVAGLLAATRPDLVAGLFLHGCTTDFSAPEIHAKFGDLNKIFDRQEAIYGDMKFPQEVMAASMKQEQTASKKDAATAALRNDLWRTRRSFEIVEDAGHCGTSSTLMYAQRSATWPSTPADHPGARRALG
ncbi:hypothetical protein JL720_17384 [Aureococcus anophagefferens]|nr:hypothetical protein JL720_17384 [Aureococcus anophagefferens]